MKHSVHLLAVAITCSICCSASAEPWRRHTIDRSSRGADGVRLADVNGDGLPDITTGWEEGGVVRVYVNPGPNRTKRSWPAVTVGRVASPEDAVFVDLDGDGATDVVSSCEGETKTVFVHWAPSDPQQYLDSNAWKTEAVACTAGESHWMYAVALQVDGRRGVDLVVGSKGKTARVGWLESPENPRDLSAWRYHHAQDAGWIMSLDPADVDGDGMMDVIVSDRRGDAPGTYWLKHPGPRQVAGARRWQRFDITGAGKEVMFLAVSSAAHHVEVVTPLRSGPVLWSRGDRSGGKVLWETISIKNDRFVGDGKAVALGDIDIDGQLDLVYTVHTGGDRTKPGVSWWSYRESRSEPIWQCHDISGREGVKFDRIELVDLDADGDLDVLTCEEADNLGVFWYENPTRDGRGEH